MKLVQISHTYEQEGDCCDGAEQRITIETDDGGAGPFLIIRTERWAIDLKEIDDFANKLREVLRLFEQP